MRTERITSVGRFKVDFEIANYSDLLAVRTGTLKPEKVRRVKLAGVIDSGATRLVLPQKAAKELGLEHSKEKIQVRYANNSVSDRHVVEGVYLELLGRHSIFNAIVEPKRESALIGAIVLEDLDLLVDCTAQKLYPRDPRFIVSEVG